MDMRRERAGRKMTFMALGASQSASWRLVFWGLQPHRTWGAASGMIAGGFAGAGGTRAGSSEAGVDVCLEREPHFAWCTGGTHMQCAATLTSISLVVALHVVVVTLDTSFFFLIGTGPRVSPRCSTPAAERRHKWTQLIVSLELLHLRRRAKCVKNDGLTMGAALPLNTKTNKRRRIVKGSSLLSAGHAPGTQSFHGGHGTATRIIGPPGLV
ncbi:hypothetical protein IWZ01DRAFT_91903 [Phyllosticta capitalensis]